MLKKKKILMNSFFNVQFKYCPLIWMLHSRRNNNIIRNLKERCLRLIYKHKNSLKRTEELLTKDGSVSIHHGNIQAFSTEFYKIKNGLSLEIFIKIFARETESHYNLRRCNNIRIPSIRTVYHGSESISLLGLKIWNILPDEIKQQTSLNSFKNSVKKWKSQDYPCRLCKNYFKWCRFPFLVVIKTEIFYCVLVVYFFSFKRH